MTERTTGTTRAPDAPAEAGRPRRDGPRIPAEWRDGMTRLQTMPPPAGFPPDRWRQVQQDAARLLDEHGDELSWLGWTATDLFGVHPAAPGVAIYCVGLAVVLGGARVVEVTPEHAAFVRPSGARLTFVRRPVSEAVPLWQLDA